MMCNVIFLNFTHDLFGSWLATPVVLAEDRRLRRLADNLFATLYATGPADPAKRCQKKNLVDMISFDMARVCVCVHRYNKRFSSVYRACTILIKQAAEVPMSLPMPTKLSDMR